MGMLWTEMLSESSVCELLCVLCSSVDLANGYETGRWLVVYNASSSMDSVIVISNLQSRQKHNIFFGFMEAPRNVTAGELPRMLRYGEREAPRPPRDRETAPGVKQSRCRDELTE